MRVFVTGGTGAIGEHAVPALVAEGHAVSALARTPAKAAEVAEQGATPVLVSMFDPPALAAVFDGHDAVVNLATAMPSTARFVFRHAWRATERVRTEGSAAVVEARITTLTDLVQERDTGLLRPLLNPGSGLDDLRERVASFADRVDARVHPHPQRAAAKSLNVAAWPSHGGAG